MYSQKQRVSIINEVCKRIAQGEALNKICKTEGMPSKDTIFEWLDKNKLFSDQYARARERQAELFLDEIIEIADESSLDRNINEEGKSYVDHEVVARSRLRVDVRKWAMSKLAPKKYGDKIQQEITGKDGKDLIPPSFTVVFSDDKQSED